MFMSAAAEVALSANGLHIFVLQLYAGLLNLLPLQQMVDTIHSSCASSTWLCEVN
jgi:hypothetical protein